MQRSLKRKVRTDKQLLNWLAEKGKSGMKWVVYENELDGGIRLCQESYAKFWGKPGSTPREAIDIMMRADKNKKKIRNK